MSAASAVLFFVLVALGFTVTGIVGFGANVLMMPILSMVFPIQDLVLIFALISFINASYRVVESRRGILWRPFLRMVLVSSWNSPKLASSRTRVLVVFAPIMPSLKAPVILELVLRTSR